MDHTATRRTRPGISHKKRARDAKGRPTSHAAAVCFGSQVRIQCENVPSPADLSDGPVL